MIWERYLFDPKVRDGINSIFNAFGSNAKGLGEGFVKGLGDLFGGSSAVDYLDPNGSSAAKEQYDYNSALQEDAQAFNSKEAEKNRTWQEMMSNTAYRRAFEDLKAAGYNPYLALGAGNGAATTSGATASSALGSVQQRTNNIPAYITAAMSSAKSMTDVLKIIAAVALMG